MSANMLIATIAAPANRTEPLDFEAGRRALAEITDPAEFTFEDFWATAENVLDDLDPDVDPIHADGRPVLELAQRVGRTIIDTLEKTFDDPEHDAEIDYRDIAGYRLYISGGLSWGGPPTDAAEAIWNALELPKRVLQAIGFVLDTSGPLVEDTGATEKPAQSVVVGE